MNWGLCANTIGEEIVVESHSGVRNWNGDWECTLWYWAYQAS